MKTSTLVQASDPRDLKAWIDAKLAAGKDVYLITALAAPSWYVVVHDV